MLSFGGAYASGLLSTNVIVRPWHGLFAYSNNSNWKWYSFNSYCTSSIAFEVPRERHECMCHFISKNFPLKMVALDFSKGRSGCLPLADCVEIVLERQGGRELFLSPDYILSQMVESEWCDGLTDMATCYAQFGLRPCITKADIDRYYNDDMDKYESIHLSRRRSISQCLAKF